MPASASGRAHGWDRLPAVRVGPVLSRWDPVARHAEVRLEGGDELYNGAAADALVELLRARVGPPPAAPYTVVIDLRGLRPGCAAWRRTLAAALMADRDALRIVAYNAHGLARSVARLFVRATGVDARLFVSEAEARAHLGLPRR